MVKNQKYCASRTQCTCSLQQASNTEGSTSETSSGPNKRWLRALLTNAKFQFKMHAPQPQHWLKDMQMPCRNVYAQSMFACLRVYLHKFSMSAN